MSKRKYTHIKMLLPEIKQMMSEGKSQREIEKYFNLTGEKPIHHLLKQERRREKNLSLGIIKHKKGRPRKYPVTTQQELELENKRLRMENELLRDFLCEIERG